MNETISRIEAKLLEREVQSLKTEIEKGAQIIINAIRVLYDSECNKEPAFKGDKTKELTEFLAMFVLPRTTYYAGDYTYVTCGKTAAQVPDFIKEILLKHAVDKFMKDIEDVQSVL